MGDEKTGKRRLPLLLGVAAAAVLVVVGGLLIFRNTDGEKNGTPAPTAQPSASATGAARDGGFEFAVGEVRCAVARVGTDALNKVPTGQYCLVTLAVTNTTGAPQAFTDSLQKALLSTGASERGDAVAGVYANGDNQSLAQPVAAGARATGVVVFDIPKDAKITKLELHGATSDGGVTVPVG